MIKGGPKIVNDGLVLCLDAHDAKSYAGEPTTNFLYRETPRIDSSYSTYVHASNSTWASNHPNALRVYNTDGTEISSYVNQGANSGNWQVIAHAHWVYDEDLKKPVVRMHRVAGYEGQWRALSSSLGHNLSELGLTAGDKFTISWLQKAYVTGVYARAGLYMRNTSGSRSFWAGQAYSSDVGQLSSELGKWAHKSKTFTVPSGMDETGYDVALYMYGHYSPTHQNEILISDVQVETGDYATPIVQGVSSTNSGYWGTRSATNGWVDRTGNSTGGTLTNMIGTEVSHYRDGQVIMPVANSYLRFDGSNDKIQVDNIPQIFDGSVTMESWFFWDDDSRSIIFGNYNQGAGGHDVNFEKLTSRVLRIYWNRGERDVTTSANVVTTSGEWQHVVMVRDASNNNFRFYVNGSLIQTTSNAGSNITSTGSTFRIGADTRDGTTVTNGGVGVLRLYNKALTAAEVLSNYNATKGRFS